MANDELRLVVGDELKLAHGVHATVVKFDDDGAVWLNVNRGKTAYGVSKYSLRDVEGALAGKRLAIAAQPTGGKPGLPIAGRVALVVVPVLALLGIIAAIARTGARDERDEYSYQYGYQTIGPTAAALRSAGSEGDVCRSAYIAVAGFLDDNGQTIGSHYVMKDVMDGCLDRIGR